MGWLVSRNVLASLRNNLRNYYYYCYLLVKKQQLRNGSAKLFVVDILLCRNKRYRGLVILSASLYATMVSSLDVCWERC